MARHHAPPEVRSRQWTEGTVWELLVAAQALPYRLASPLADLGMTTSQRRRLRREEELLKTTRVAYILPRPSTARRPAQPWLYVHTRRSGYYRVNDQGVIDRYGKRIQHLGSGSITEHRWYPSTLRGVRWLQVIADGLIVRKVRSELGNPAPGATVSGLDPNQQATQDSRSRPVQLALFADVDEEGVTTAAPETSPPAGEPPTSPGPSPRESAGAPRC